MLDNIINDMDRRIYFGKLHKYATIPSKLDEDAGYDIYAALDDDVDQFIIPRGEVRFIPTGLVSAFSSKFVAILKERGSTGKWNISQGCGVIDSGYRGEWLVPWRNHNVKKDICISKLHSEITETKNCIYYPYTKAITQAVIVPVPSLVVTELTAEQIKEIPSSRGEGKFGSTGK